MKTDVALLILRLNVGITMLVAHGWPKLTGFTEMSKIFPDPIGMGSTVALALAVFAEVFCSVAITLGLLTRLASIPLIVTMVVAAFIIHGADPFAKKELALMYLCTYVFFALAGAGKYSMDKLVLKKQ